MRPKCVVDECTSNSATTNKFGMCFKHGEWASFILWMVPRIKTDKTKGSALWTPQSGPSGIIKES